MAITIQNLDSSKVISSLDTYNYTVPAAGIYNISAQMNEIPTSSLSVVIKVNTVTKASSATPTANQSIVDLQLQYNCALNDIISFVVSSSAAVEAGSNQIKGIINIQPVSLA